MRTHQSIRKRGARKKREVLDLDITSLLDILVIMLVFLLKSYNSSGVTFNYPEGIKLPTSRSESPNTFGVAIQMSKEKIWLDDKELVDLEKAAQDPYYRKTVFDPSSEGRMIIPLYNELVNKKTMVKRVEQSSENAKKFSGIANLIVDKDIRYTQLRKILYTVAEAGYKQYKFVVLGEEQ